MNMTLLKRIAAQIVATPEQFDMATWHARPEAALVSNRLSVVGTDCGTTHCIAGWAQVLGEGARPDGDAFAVAKRLLRISEEQAWTLFFEEEWPDEFRPFHFGASAQQAAARIAHFIATDGAE